MDTNAPTLFSLITIGARRSSAGFLFEHPLELLKLSAQANPNNSTIQVINRIITNEGFFGFTKTILTNFPRRILREAVRWPVIGFTHEHLVMRYPEIFTRNGIASKIFTGFSVAFFECAIILPIEQLMAYRVKEGEKYSTFFKSRFIKEGASSLYKGVLINLIRQGMLWSTVMGMNYECKRVFDLVDKKKNHPYLRQSFTSIFISLGLISWCLPIDFIKTRIQMEKSYKT